MNVHQTRRLTVLTTLTALAVGVAAALGPDSATARPSTHASARDILDPTGHLATPLHVALEPFADRILGMHNGDAAKAKVAVEQWASMFSSLPAAGQRAVLDDLRSGDLRKFYGIVQGGLAQRLAEMHAARPATTNEAQDTQKLAPADNEYIFVPSAPCRIMDTRTWSPLGAIGAQRVRNLYAFANGPGYNWSAQGGTGTSGVGNCSATVFPEAAPPKSVLATVTVLSPAAAGNLRAWDGSTPIPTASMLNFAANQNVANTTIIPIQRGVQFTGPGGDVTGHSDIAIWNESAGATHVIVDVVGYFAKPAGYALSCTNQSNSVTATGAGFLAVTAPNCPAGTSRTGLLCGTTCMASRMNSSGNAGNSTCEWSTTTAGSTYTAYNICCALP